MGGRFAAAGGTAVCLLPIISFRSLAAARSLLLLDSSCGAVPIAPCRAICLGCLIARFLGRPFFLLKRFNEFDVPVSRSSSSRHLWQCCLLTALRFVLRLASRLVRSSRSPPWGDVIAALPDCSPCRSGLAVIDRPALLVGWLGAGRVGSGRPLCHRLLTLPTLLACSGVGRLRLF